MILNCFQVYAIYSGPDWIGSPGYPAVPAVRGAFRRASQGGDWIIGSSAGCKITEITDDFRFLNYM